MYLLEKLRKNMYIIWDVATLCTDLGDSTYCRVLDDRAVGHRKNSVQVIKVCMRYGSPHFPSVKMLYAEDEITQVFIQNNMSTIDMRWHNAS